jgi:hypothetical protein
LKKTEEKVIKRVRKAVPRGLARKLWVKSGGRCEYASCNKPLWKDELMQRDMNKAYISHIIAASENGPRGEKGKSEDLELEFDNLLLLCDECHNRIDKAQVSEHPKELLIGMKQSHENRIETVTSISEDKKSHILIYTANIGAFEPKISFMDAAIAMKEKNFPRSDSPIHLGLGRGVFADDEDTYWSIQYKQLEASFAQKIKPVVEKGENHFSVFGLAPQPLLIKLGVLLSEVINSEIYQSHREPVQTWEWPKNENSIEVQLTEPATISKVAALVISISDNVAEERIKKVLGSNVSIWEITVETPNRNILKSRETLKYFKNKVREAFSKIREALGEEGDIHLFPVMPNSCAIETGKVWMSKVDLPLIIYDQNKKRDGFYKTITIK